MSVKLSIKLLTGGHPWSKLLTTKIKSKSQDKSRGRKFWSKIKKNDGSPEEKVAMFWKNFERKSDEN
jgi:hypothetical protein